MLVRGAIVLVETWRGPCQVRERKSRQTANRFGQLRLRRGAVGDSQKAFAVRTKCGTGNRHEVFLFKQGASELL